MSVSQAPRASWNHERPSRGELSALAREARIPFVEDVGSGALFDTARYGLEHEPTVSESLTEGADLVTFSGDKLLGGPQAGLIVGRREFVEILRKDPLARALRVDKLTVAALEATLAAYLEPGLAEREVLADAEIEAGALAGHGVGVLDFLIELVGEGADHGGAALLPRIPSPSELELMGPESEADVVGVALIELADRGVEAVAGGEIPVLPIPAEPQRLHEEIADAE